MMKQLLGLVLLLSISAPAFATEQVSTSCTEADVASKWALVSSGDGLFLDCASVTWTAQVSLTAPANTYLRGRGSTSILGGDDLTVITDSFASADPLLIIDTNASGTFRLYGISIVGGSTGGNIKPSGVLAVAGLSASFRMDHSTMDAQTYSPVSASTLIRFTGYVRGVVDNNIFRTHSVGNGVQVWYSDEDARWADPTNFGSSDFLFVEDNEFYGNSGSFPTAGSPNDCFKGGKQVFRYNTTNNSGGVQTHSTSTFGRGCRALEMYGNDLVDVEATPGFSAFGQTSGASIVWGNTTTFFIHFLRILNTRRDQAEYDEDQPPDGWGFCGPAVQSGVVDTSGTAVTWVSGGTFDTGWLDGHTIWIAGAKYIIDTINSTTSITLVASAGTQNDVAYALGSNWDGNTGAGGYPCIDQPARGDGDLLTGTFPNKMNNATGMGYDDPGAWPRQALEPIYQFLNTWSEVPGNPGQLVEASDIFTQNMDWYSYTANFDGTTSCTGAPVCGVGSGTRASRPASTRNGLAWWATDQGGDWSTAGAANDGCLDIVQSGAWVNCVYTPYTYPHPLVDGEPPGGGPPVATKVMIR